MMKALRTKIKNNDVGHIIQRERLVEIPWVKEESDLKEKKEMHKNLTIMRKRYDEVKRV
jgi:hypothetical protein